MSPVMLLSAQCHDRGSSEVQLYDQLTLTPGDVYVVARLIDATLAAMPIKSFSTMLVSAIRLPPRDAESAPATRRDRAKWRYAEADVEYRCRLPRGDSSSARTFCRFDADALIRDSFGRCRARFTNAYAGDIAVSSPPSPKALCHYHSMSPPAHYIFPGFCRLPTLGDVAFPALVLAGFSGACLLPHPPF